MSFRLVPARGVCACLGLLPLLICFAIAPQHAPAADYNVTSAVWGTPTDVGSFAWAVDQANTNPGLDTIRVSSGLQIDVDSGSLAPGVNAWLANFTESVVVEGNGAQLVANPTYVTSGGLVATKTNIVGSAYSSPLTPTDVVTTPGVSFAAIGTFNQDNTGIDVSIRNLHADGVGSVAVVFDNASLSVDGGNYNNIVNYTGYKRGAIDSLRGTVNLNGISLNRNFPFDDVIPVGDDYAVFAGSITNLDGTLNIQNSSITNSYGAGAVASSGGTTNIVSSIVDGAGGVSVADSQVGSGTLNLTNSIMSFQGSGETLQQTTRIIAEGASVANVNASTVLYNSLFTTGPTQPYNDNGMPLSAVFGGTLNVNSSVVVPLNWDLFYAGHDTYLEANGGSLTADGLSYIAATAAQDAAALEALFGATGFLTSGETFAIIDVQGVDVFADLPVGAVPVTGSPLIDAVANAGTGGVNELINPIDGLPILFDVYGNARTTSLGFRNIGAVQAVPEPQTFVLALCGAGLVLAGRRWRRQACHPPIRGR